MLLVVLIAMVVLLDALLVVDILSVRRNHRDRHPTQPTDVDNPLAPSTEAVMVVAHGRHRKDTE